jgi:hypothetical protein
MLYKKSTTGEAMGEVMGTLQHFWNFSIIKKLGQVDSVFKVSLPLP